MSQICPHGNSYSWVPAGVSRKTGKSYQGFMAKPDCCKNAPPDQPDPPGYPQQSFVGQPEPPYQNPIRPPQAAPAGATAGGPDWEAKDRLSAMQTALNCSSSVFHGHPDLKAGSIDHALTLYEILIGVKAGHDPHELLARMAQDPDLRF